MTRRGLFGMLAAVVYGTYRVPVMLGMNPARTVLIDSRAIAWAVVDEWHAHRVPLPMLLTPGEVILTNDQQQSIRRSFRRA